MRMLENTRWNLLPTYGVMSKIISISKQIIMKKLSKDQLKKINGAACPGGCPYPAGTTFGPPGSGATRSCQQYNAVRGSILCRWVV